MLAWLAPLLVFGLVIFVHELGHFIAAKSVGVYAPRFSIGFGPALFRRRKGETEYVLAAFPLGGYVRMASRLDEATSALEGGSEEKTAVTEQDPNFDPNAMIPFGPKPVPEDRWFESKPLWARIYIMLAGVTMNFILGIVVAIGLALHFGRPVVTQREIGAVRVIAGKQWFPGVRVGDTLTRVNGVEVHSWSEAIGRIMRSADSVSVETNRTRVTVPLTGTGSPTAEDVAGAIDYQIPAVIGDVLPGEPGSKAGLRPGDTVVTIDGGRIESWWQMLTTVSRSPGKTLAFGIRRADGSHVFRITPKPQDGFDPETGERGQVGKIGAARIDLSTREPVTLGEASVAGLRAAWLMGTTVIGTVRGLLARNISVDQLGGPIAITRASVQAAKSGMEYLWGLIAFISINVGVFNLLPIPILDGGQILINVLETARGTPFTLRTREYVLRGGLFFILLLFVVVMFNDIRALIFG